MRHLAALLAAAALVGCAGMPTIDDERRTVSSGFIGCPASEIAVSDHKQYTWTATCKQQVFYCTVAPSAACTRQLQ